MSHWLGEVPQQLNLTPNSLKKRPWDTNVLTLCEWDAVQFRRDAAEVGRKSGRDNNGLGEFPRPLAVKLLGLD